MSDLFATSAAPRAPLAEQLRPQTLADVIGQSHLLGPGKPIRLAFESKKIHSMILWGPPGVGKTTLARLMPNAFYAQFIALSAVFSGMKEIREAISQAQSTLDHQGRHTVLFVDEVHRFNKAQQDAFLPYVERGLITFIGATTENPSFELNNALLSRAAVYVLQPLNEAELTMLVDRAFQALSVNRCLTELALERVLAHADGDARRILNLMEQLSDAASQQGLSKWDEPFVANILTHVARRFDKGGDVFYDQISALHKSVRGSNPDAALYWFTRMLDAGADPRYIARRMVRMASEDIGLADPRALRLTLDACESYERLGSPEGELALAQAVIYLAVAAKSNAAYVAYNEARALVREESSRPVPEHLRNAPTQLMKDLGHGVDYRYAHDEPDAYAAGESYFPKGMREPHFYQPKLQGLEIKIAEKLETLQRRDREARAKIKGATKAL